MQNRVGVTAQTCTVDWLQRCTPGNKLRDGHGTAPQLTELGNFCTVTRDEQRFATGDTV